jgi:oxygen-independent coproporphyrinogen-3 oxidase
MLEFAPQLVRKYDGLGPRYTSYPTADRFTEGFTWTDYATALAAHEGDLSLYVHVPFCDTICFYCACNKVITRNRAHAGPYVEHLAREVEMVDARLRGSRKVVQLHFGGGTPTFLSPAQMREVVTLLRSKFEFAPDIEMSIEVDPRKVDCDGIAGLAQLGFNRLSVGIQDFDTAVQVAVNRVQSQAQTLSVMQAARENGFVSINVDLIYGLPLQTVDGFAATLDKVIAAGPDRIAIYSYAHLPHLFKTQKQIDAAQLPSPDEKLAILALAIEKLTLAGYVHIGMDHFAKPDDELARAQREGTLHRNFQGYSTKADTDLVAFGVSAIGKIGNTYAQNAKSLDDYYARIESGALPVVRGVALDDDDRMRREVIQKIMCDFAVDLGGYALDPEQYFAAEIAALAPLEADGLVRREGGHVEVTAAGRLLVRNVAMTFDRRLRESRGGTRYSRVI